MATLTQWCIRTGIGISAASIMGFPMSADAPALQRKNTNQTPTGRPLNYRALPPLRSSYGLGVVMVPEAPNDVVGEFTPRRRDGCPVDVRAISGGYAMLAAVTLEHAERAESTFVRVGETFTAPLGKVKLLALVRGPLGPSIKIRFRGAIMRCPLVI